MTTFWCFWFLFGLFSKTYAATCSGAPPNINNGWRSHSTSSATYYCNTGYSGSGTQTISCVYSIWGNYWPSASYTCTIRNCGTPSTISNGYRSYSSTTYGSTATYYCNTGYSGSGTNSISCQSSGSWSSLGYSCTIKDCGTPTTLSNGYRSYSSTTYGSTAYYYCNTGYTGSGTNSISCQSSGSWSSLGYSCIIKDCGTPTTISNGYRSYSSTTYGSTATYYCNTGYSGSGTNSISCQSSGSWSSLGYSCTIKDCGTPSGLSNGYASYSSTTYNSQATYSCNSGYTGVGNTHQITCQSSGSWSSRSYTCYRECGNPTTISNGARSYSTTYHGSTATYSCNTGYSGSGSNSITCQSSGSWSSLGYTCTIKNCGTPSTLSNGARSYSSTTYLSTATYSCNTGYYSTGTATITCQSSGSWSSLSYYCTIRNCGTPPTISHGSRSYSTTTYGSSVSYSCNTGYYGTNSNSISCQSSGSWATLSYYCTIRDCGSPPSVSNAGRSYSSTTYNSVVTYSCNTGYTASGTSTITCNSAGNWPTPSYTCTIKDCGTVPSVTYATPSYSTTTYNSKVTYSCITGYYTTGGSNQITCSSAGTWPTPNYVCQIKDCGTPTTISNGYRTYTTTTYQSTVTFYCNTGYEGSGTQTITCLSSGSWASLGYTCTIISCGNPSSPSNGNVAYTTTTYLSTATFTCNTGYLGTEVPSTTCQANKVWSGSFTCYLAADSAMTVTGYGYQSAAQYGITGYDRNEIVMDLQGLDVFIALSPVNYATTNMYVFVFLWSSHRYTYLRLTETGSDAETHYDASAVADYVNKKRFYIEWDTTTVKAGRIENGVKTQYISHTHSTPYEKNYILFSCYNSNTATTTFIVDCGEPAAVFGASLSNGYNTYKGHRTHTCDAGYITTSGNGTVQCQESVEWTTPTLICTPKDCGEPALIQRARAAVGETVYPHTNTYTCLSPYTASGTDTISCQTDGTWSSTNFACNLVASDILTSGYTFTSLSTYGVDPTVSSYLLFEIKACSYAVIAFSSSDSTRADMFEIQIAQALLRVTLYQSGTYYDWQSKGDSLDCSNYRQFYLRWNTTELNLGKISSTDYEHYVDTSSGSYNLNYILVASTSGNTARWNIEEPTANIYVALRARYYYMTLSSFGLIASNRDSITFQVKACKHAFIGISSAEPNSTNMYEIVIGAHTNTRTILALSLDMGGGSYVEDVTTSNILDCNAWKTFYLSWAGSQIIFGQVTDLVSMDYNQVFSYTHGSPYTKNYLLVSGYGDATVDFRFFVDCGPPPTLGNATVTSSSTVVGGTTTYACIIGWTPANSDTITCQNNGAWSEVQYTCTIVDCKDPPTIAHATWNGTTTYASVANYTCNIGYFDVNGTEMVTCQADGTWTHTDFGCQIKDCGTPNSIEFGNYTMIRSTYEGNVTYYCDIGYYSEGNESIECLHTGNWSETDFICIIVDCFDPPFVDNCDITNTTTTYLSVVNYTCHIGYLPQEGPDTITCQANGNWTDMTFWCKIIDCGQPDEIDHATVTNGSTTFWKNQTYTCDIGYVPHGLENITCMLNGNWSETDYNCPPFDCGEPAELKDSVVTAPNTTYLYMANYTCDLGHYDSDPGNMSITCTPTAWENITFWCIPVDCYPPTYELPRSTATWDTTIFRTINSSTVQYVCDIGFTIDPEEYADGLVECNYTGLWEEVEFDCIFNYCKNVSKYYKIPSSYPFQSDGLRGQMYLLNDTMYTVDCCGVISGWEFKPITTGFIYLMIWRKNDAGMPVMVAYNTVLIANTTSIVNVTITDDEKIAVMAFDQIGWYSWEASPIAYQDCNPFEEPNCPQQNLYYQGVEVIPADYQFDWDGLGNTLANRSYAIKYYFTRNTPLQFMSEEYNISIPDHWLGDQPIMTFSIVGVDHAEAVTYTLEPLGDTPQTIYFYIHSYFGTVKVSQKLPNSNETNQFVYNVTAVDGCENYAYTILTVNTFNAPPMFENLPNKLEVYDKETSGNQKLYDIVVRDPTNDPMCCTLQETLPSTQNFLLEVNGTSAKVLTTKNAYFSATFVNSYFVKFCCQDRNYSTSAVLQVKVRGDYVVEVIPFPDWFFMSLVISCVPIFALLFSSCTLMLYLTFCF